MNKTVLSFLLIAASLLSQKQILAQHSATDSLLAKKDSIAAMDSVIKELNSFLDSLVLPKSFFSAELGMGNRTFSIKNNALNTQETTTSQLSLTPALAYYNKKGPGICFTGFMANLNNSYHFYQYAITPSYDFINRTIAAGISYTRYFGKDTTTLNSSPYDNDVYAYFNLHHHSWWYGIAAGYATGYFRDNVSYPDSVQRFSQVLQKLVWVHVRKTVASQNHIQDISLSASLRKDFSWYGLFTGNDNLNLSMISYLVTGESKIKTSTQINYVLKKITLARFRRIYNDARGNNFQVQSAALSASLLYTVGKIDIMPVWFMDYYFQDTDQKFSQVFSLTFAYNF